MTMRCLLLLAASLTLFAEDAAKQHVTNQVSHGDNSPNITGVIGNVTIPAPGTSSTSTKVPLLTAEQKLAIREAQLAVSQLAERRAQLELQYREVTPALEKAQATLTDAVKQATPAGYVLQGDLTLKAEPKVEAAAKPPAP